MESSTTSTLSAETAAMIAEAVDIAHHVVWGVMTTVDAKRRPRNRVVHPVWTFDGVNLTGWLTTRRTPVKSAHLAANPHVSLAYIAANTDAAFFDCTAEWIEDAAGRQACWDAFVNAPAPVGYDPANIWPNGPTDATFEVLRFRPFRVQALRAADIARGQKAAPVKL